MSSTVPSPNDKSLGAYYTDSAVSRFLAQWAITHKNDTVFEPAFGGGAFVEASSARLGELGGEPGQIFGCELDSAAYELFSQRLLRALRLNPAQFTSGDFFDLNPGGLKVSAVLGNPPFVRYHLFSGESRSKALSRAAEAGVTLSELSSSWAPFMIHSSRFLRVQGRLAMVAPLELLQAVYARPVLKYLSESFSRVHLLTFDRRLFPDLSQDTLLVLAEGFGQGPGSVGLVRLASSADLETYLDRPNDVHEIDVPGLHAGTTRAALYRLPQVTRTLYERLSLDPRVLRLGAFADAGIGYVTGNNDFFHLSDAEAMEHGISSADLLPTVRRGRDLSIAGLSLTAQDWSRLNGNGGKYWLFHPSTLDENSRRYVQSGVDGKVNEGYKCRSRKQWWKVPWVVKPDLVLTVMAGAGPRLVANEAGVVATNSLHVVRLKRELSPTTVAASALTTLTALSAEIEGHALGGGMLKLEPSEAERLLLPMPNSCLEPRRLEAIDVAVRSGNRVVAVDLADKLFLYEILGLQEQEVVNLRQALSDLRSWRQTR